MNIGISGITPSLSRRTAVDFSDTYAEDALTFFMYKASFLPKWQAPIWPFTQMVWILVIVSIPLMGSLTWIAARISPEKNSCWTLNSSMFIAFGIIFSERKL